MLQTNCHGQLKGEGMTDEDKQLIAEYVGGQND